MRFDIESFIPLYSDLEEFLRFEKFQKIPGGEVSYSSLFRYTYCIEIVRDISLLCEKIFIYYI